jgi:hypothetical protein
MIENMEGNGVKREDIQGFLEWLRSVRLDQDNYPHLRFVFGGSTSLHYFIQIFVSQIVNDEYSFVCKVLQDWWLRWHPSLEMGENVS